METIVYNQKGEKTGTAQLPESVFGVPWNGDLVHQVVQAMRGNARTGVAHTKDRGDVSGGGKKPWKQKGTGRARHGSIRSSIWVGGGVAHGPRNEKNYVRTVSKKMRAKALWAVLSQKLRDHEIVFIDTMTLDEPKTKHAKEILASLGKIAGFEALPRKRAHAALIASGKENTHIKRSFQNFGNIETIAARNVNPVRLLNYKYLVVTDSSDAIALWAGRTASKTKAKMKKTHTAALAQ